MVFLTHSSPPGSASLGDSDWSCIPSLSYFLPGNDTDLWESSLGWWEQHSQKEPDLLQKLIFWHLFFQNKRPRQEGKEAIWVCGASHTQTQPIWEARKEVLSPLSFVRKTNTSGFPRSFVTGDSTDTQAELSGGHLLWLCRQVCGKLDILADTSVK